MNEELPLTSDYRRFECYINECANNTKDITDSEMESIYKYAGCDINYVCEATEFNFEDEKYKIESCIIQNGGEGQGEDYEEISRVFEKESGNIWFVSFQGYYDSWNGVNYDDSTWCVVKPIKMKTINFIA